MQRIILTICILLLCTSLHADGGKRAPRKPRHEIGDTASAFAIMNTATVYFGYGAELTHQVKVSVSPATKIIVIDHLSTGIDINSLQVSVPEELALLSQRYSVYSPIVVPLPKSREVEKLEDSIEILNKEIGRTRNRIEIEQEILTKTSLLIETTLTNMGNKTITSAELLKLLNMYTSRIESAKMNIYYGQQGINTFNLRIAALQTRIKDLNALAIPPKAKPTGRLVLQVLCPTSGEIPISLSYYTNNAGWTPVYDIRVNSKTNKVKLVYKASLTQTSGVDWKNTKLTLSTGTPSFGVTAPVLTPWYLQLYVPGLYNELQRRAATGNAMRNTIQSMNDDKELSEVVVTAMGEYSKRKLVDSIDPSTLQQYTSLNEGQLNTNFEISLPYDIESDGQLHSVSIKEEEISCTLKNYAVPRSDKDAYLLAEVADWQNLDLLPGDANIIMDNTYIGKSLIDPNTTADTLNLSLGKDKRIALKRSLVKEMSSLKTSGSTSKQNFTYELLLKNNKQTDVNLLLKDQFPLSTIKEVEVKIEDDGGAMVNAETGVLTWKISLKPGESTKVRFTYSVKYPKDRKIVNLK